MSQLNQIAYGLPQLPLKIGAVSIGCYILTNGTSILLKTDLHKAFGHEGKSEDWLLDLLGSINKFFPVSGAVFNALEHPVLFELKLADGTFGEAKGIPALLLPEICHTLTTAKSNGYLSVGQLKFAKAADYLLRNIDMLRLEEAIEEATGFVFLKTRAKSGVQKFFEQHSDEAAFEWVKTFPDSFFELLLKLNGQQWPDLISRPHQTAALVHDLVFSRLPAELLAELRENKPKRVYKNKFGHENDTQHAGLRTFMASITAMIQSAGFHHGIFMQLLNRAYPSCERLVAANVFLEQSFEEPPSELETMLKKALEFRKVYVTKK